MRDYWIRLKLILEAITCGLELIGLVIIGGSMVLFIIGLFANTPPSWAIMGTVYGFGIFLSGLIIDNLINYKPR